MPVMKIVAGLLINCAIDSFMFLPDYVVEEW